MSIILSESRRLLTCVTFVILALLILFAKMVVADVDAYQFDTETERERYQSFIKEMRCPKCQNQNLADSNSPISADLRRELRRMIDEGYSDAEIVDYMVSRYGEFVLYKPRLQDETLLLWFGPGVLLVIGLMVLVWLLRQRGGRTRQQAGILTSEDRQRLAELLAEHSTQAQCTEEPANKEDRQ